MKRSAKLSSTVFTWLLILLITTACSDRRDRHDTGKDSGSEATWSPETFGWLHGNCLAIRQNALAKGTAVTIIDFTDPPKILTGKVAESAQDGTSCYALLEDRQQVNRDAGSSFYLIDTGNNQEVGLGIGLLHPLHFEIDRAGQISGDVDSDGKADYLTQCATSEGISFAVWSDEPYKGTPFWDEYYYMGYDMEPTCPLTDE